MTETGTRSTVAARTLRSAVVNGSLGTIGLALVEKLLERGKVVGLPLMRPGRQMEVRRYDPAIPLIRHKFGILP